MELSDIDWNCFTFDAERHTEKSVKDDFLMEHALDWDDKTPDTGVTDDQNHYQHRVDQRQNSNLDYSDVDFLDSRKWEESDIENIIGSLTNPIGKVEIQFYKFICS